ncbi:MAG: carbamoyltransferase C-terminal domain-containing protein [Sarcina sp.]
MSNVYLGKEYLDNEIEKALNKFCDLKFYKQNKSEILAAEYISQGKIVGWFQGKSEFGPRALGNRSILADPRDPNMKDIVNNKVKFREHFRPFAPSVLWEYQFEYFDLDIQNPYMLIVREVKKEKRALIPSVTHVDNTGRIHTVIKKENKKYYDLIKSFQKITGVPVVLDTSFNIKGEPIVETPEDAIKCFLGTKIDILILGDYIVEKKESEELKRVEVLNLITNKIREIKKVNKHILETDYIDYKGVELSSIEILTLIVFAEDIYKFEVDDDELSLENIIYIKDLINLIIKNIKKS